MPNQAIICISLTRFNQIVMPVTAPNPIIRDGYFVDVNEHRNLSKSPDVWSAFSSLYA